MYVETPRVFGVFQVSCVEELFSFLRSANEPRRFIYRGQSDAKWTLETKLARNIPAAYKRTMGLQSCEQAILDRFKRRAHHYLPASHIPGEDDLEWLALIQHHGGPTRLLAESSDFLTAAIQREISFLAAITAGPFRQNRRLLQQQGLFVLPLDVNQPFLTNLVEMFRPVPQVIDRAPKPLSEVEETDDFAIIKFVINKRDFPRFRSDLRQMNISTETLFPDLEGEARGLSDIVTNHVFVGGVV